jgi:hypothetical protein
MIDAGMEDGDLYIFEHERGNASRVYVEHVV